MTEGASVWVIHTNEEPVIAQHTLALILCFSSEH